jgi:hypothetical protein
MTAVGSSPSITPLTQRPAWRALEAHYRSVKDTQMIRRYRELRRAP